VGPGEQEARKLNEAFAKYIRTGRPLVTLKSAMSLDGKIAPVPGDSTTPTALGAEAAKRGYITSRVARAHVHQLRHAADAILVGVGTVVADDPLLTDRTGRPRRRPLLRVILDTRLRLSLDSRIVKTANNDVVVFCSFADAARRKELEQRGVRVEQVQHSGMAGRPEFNEIVRRLGEMQITSLMIEGGSLVNWAAIAADIVDKVWLYYAPIILGGTGSVSFAAGPGFRKLKDAAQVRNTSLHRFGEDFAVEGYIKDPYAPETANR
jgi:diaminohydroxyphosphoribosylaminopyrimidine deaminase/5-amino-6-(5-phosphoribosylamino)uracil reductase